MQPIVTVMWSVCLLVTSMSAGPTNVTNRQQTSVSPAKTAELIQMPFGGLNLMGTRNHVLDGVEIPPLE